MIKDPVDEIFEKIKIFIDNLKNGNTFSKNDLKLKIVLGLFQKDLEDNTEEFTIKVKETIFQNFLEELCLIGVLYQTSICLFMKERSIPKDLTVDVLDELVKVKDFSTWFISLEDRIKIYNGG